MRKNNCKCNPPHIPDDPCWEHKCACVEDHTKVEQTYAYTTTVNCLTPFNMPKVGDSLELELDKVQSVLPGAILWNKNVGYLHVDAFDADTCMVLVHNEDENGNKTVGAAVLANEKFHVGIPEADKTTVIDFSNSPMLAADFISPGEGKCQTATVTSVNGISENGQVSIQGYVYRASVLDRQTLKLCNDGKGAPEGHVFDFDPYECDVPAVSVVPYSDSPCTAATVGYGNSIMVCDGTNVAPLTGDATGQILIWDEGYKKWTLKYVDLNLTCTTLTSCLIVDTTEDTEYIVNIHDIPAGFSKDNKVVINGTSFIITEVLSYDTEDLTNRIRVKPAVTPTDILTFGRGDTICLEECCDWVPTKLKETVDSDEWRPSNIGTISYANSTVTEVKADDLPELDAANEYFMTDTDPIVVANANPNAPLEVLIRAYLWVHGGIRYTGNSATGMKKINIKDLLAIKYTINSADTVDNTVLRKGIEFDVASYSSNKRNEDFFQSNEVLLELPAYEEDHPELSSVSIVATGKHKLLKGASADTEWFWRDEKGDDDDPGDETPQKSFVLKLVVEAIRV